MGYSTNRAALIAAGLCALGFSACGGRVRQSSSEASSAERPTDARSAVGSQADAYDYRWLVPSIGAPPSIARENRARGTRAWRLPGPSGLEGGAARGAVEGYVAMQAIAPGQIQRVYVNAPGSRTVRLRIYRIGWYGGTGGRLVLRSGRLAAVRQPPCTHRFSTGLTECDWHATLSFPIPEALASGVYIVKLLGARGAQSDCLFVVRSSHPPPLLVEIPTATYEAYNAWGGDSLYPGGAKLVGVTHTSQGVEVSYDRPYDSQTGAGQFFIREVAIVRFLERYGYPVAYTTIESIDGAPGQVMGARALIDVGHSEYWSERDEQAFARARGGGESLIFISSDTIAWRVRFEPATRASSQAGETDHVIVAYKENVGIDPDHLQPSGLFPEGGANLVGSSYNGCITPRVQQPGPPVYRYYAWRPATGPEARVAVRPQRRNGRYEYPRNRRLRAGSAHSGDCARHAPDRHGRRGAVSGRDRALAGARHAGRDNALHGALGCARVRHGDARLGVRALARAPGLSRRATRTRLAGRDDDPQPPCPRAPLTSRSLIAARTRIGPCSRSGKCSARR